MAKIPGSVQVTGFFAPTDDKDTFGVSDPRWGIGGYSTWGQWSDITSIPPGRRRLGMLVFNQNITTLDPLNGIYKLINNPTTDITEDSDWESLTTGGGGGGTLHLAWAAGIDYLSGDISTQTNRTFMATRDHTSVAGSGVDGPPMEIDQVNPGGASTAWIEVVTIYKEITSTVKVGGVDPNTTFAVNTSITDILDQILSPYLKAQVGHLTINPAASIEVGTQILISSADIIWSNDSNGLLPINMAIIDADGFSGAPFPTTGESGSVTAVPSTNMQHDVVTTVTWKFIADSPQGGSAGDVSKSIKWMNMIYFGASSSASLSEGEVKALGHNLKTGSSGSYSFGAEAGTYKWICVVSTEVQPTVFKDNLTKLPVAMEPAITVGITNTHSISLSMKCYRTTNILNGAITIVLS
ncbi:MAG: hypothetical protein KAH32_04735 [Chlamydiia bacterium]|nr:hypothetical protein [Chlamydiia bacterium]